MRKYVFEIQNLDLVFGDNKFHLENINDIVIKSGEILGVLGESGCGKSTFGKCLIGLINYRDKERFNITQFGIIRNDALIKSPMYSYIFHGNNIMKGTKKELRHYRKHVQMIFQNPRSALNLNMPVHKILKEAIRLDEPKIEKVNLEKKVEDIAERFELGGNNWARIKFSKPKDLSGGERRRIGIAKVFATNPDVIIADEPVASLDVSVRGKILKTLLKEWKKRQAEWKKGTRDNPLTIIIISHDFNLIQKMCHRTMVLYGDIHVKRGTVIEVFENKNLPEKMHPYTEKLRKDAYFMSHPEISTKYNNKIVSRKKTIKSGCVFVNHCPKVKDRCIEKQPPLKASSKREDYFKACFFDN